jgi:hypothetical protein
LTRTTASSVFPATSSATPSSCKRGSIVQALWVAAAALRATRHPGGWLREEHVAATTNPSHLRQIPSLERHSAGRNRASLRPTTRAPLTLRKRHRLPDSFFTRVEQVLVDTRGGVQDVDLPSCVSGRTPMSPSTGAASVHIDGGPGRHSRCSWSRRIICCFGMITAVVAVIATTASLLLRDNTESLVAPSC